MLVNKNNQKGEIVTMLVIATVVVLSAVTLASSLFLKNQQITRSEAATFKLCSDNPESPPTGDTWKADCSKACHSNSDCPKNISDPANINSETSNWCYGFEGAAKTWDDWRCLMLIKGTAPPGGQQSTTPPSGACFSLSTDFEVRPEGGKKAFYAWVTFQSQKGGDVQLEYNGAHVAGWNGFAGGRYTYDPRWTQPFTNGAYEAGVAALDNGGSVTANYRGMLSSCQPQSLSINCVAGVRSDGSTYVTGNSCSCRNCSAAPVPTTPPAQVLTQPPGGVNPPVPVTACGGNKPIQSLCSSYENYCPIGKGPNAKSYYVWSGKGSYEDVACSKSIPDLPSYCCVPKSDTTACGGNKPIQSLCSSYENYCPIGKGPNAKSYYVWSGKGSYEDVACSKSIPDLPSYCCVPKSDTPPAQELLTMQRMITFTVAGYTCHGPINNLACQLALLDLNTAELDIPTVKDVFNPSKDLRPLINPKRDRFSYGLLLLNATYNLSFSFQCVKGEVFTNGIYLYDKNRNVAIYISDLINLLACNN